MIASGMIGRIKKITMIDCAGSSDNYRIKRIAARQDRQDSRILAKTFQGRTCCAINKKAGAFMEKQNYWAILSMAAA